MKYRTDFGNGVPRKSRRVAPADALRLASGEVACAEPTQQQAEAFEAAAEAAALLARRLAAKGIRPFSPAMAGYLAQQRVRAQHRERHHARRRAVASRGRLRPHSDRRPACRVTREAHSSRGPPSEPAPAESEGEPSGPRQVGPAVDRLLVSLVRRSAESKGQSVREYVRRTVELWDGPQSGLRRFLALAEAAAGGAQ